MATATSNLRVSDHLYGVVDQGRIDIDSADWSNGLAILLRAGALIYTGIERGAITVTAETHRAAPILTDPAAWDDIVEVSVHAPIGRLAVQQLEYRANEDQPPLPLLSPDGPGYYRIRAHTRGRDQHFDQVQPDSGEQYLLQVWPHEPQPTLIIRATDHCGYGLRLSAITRHHNP